MRSNRGTLKLKLALLLVCGFFLYEAVAAPSYPLWAACAQAINMTPADSSLAGSPDLDEAVDTGDNVSQAIVKFKDGTGSYIETQLIEAQGDTIIYRSRSGFYVIEISSEKTLVESIEDYARLAEVEYAEPNSVRRTNWEPDDPFYQHQWNFDQIGMERAWDLTRSGSQYGGESWVIVAISDTGIAYESYGTYDQAPDLASTHFWTNSNEIPANNVDDDGNGYVDDIHGWDFINNDAHPNDDGGHGTHVCGTIAQSTNNALGVAGIAFNVTIMPVKVLDDKGAGTDAQVADGIYYAVDNGARIINLSLGGSVPSRTLEDAVAYAHGAGVIVVAAAGNGFERGNQPQYPAAYNEYAVAVGATRYDRTRAYYSNTGPYLDIVAPGGDLTVDQNGDRLPDGILQQTFTQGSTIFDYLFFQGTSMACPHVSGTAGLVMSKHPKWSAKLIMMAIESSTADLGEPGKDAVYGWGLLDAAAALSWAPPPNVFFEGFEDNLSQWTQDGQLDWSRSTQEAREGIYSAGVQGRANDSSLILKEPIDLGWASEATFTFSWMISASLDIGEYAALDLWDGNDWNEMLRLDGDVDAEGVWHDEVLPLAAEYLRSDFKFRFRGRMSIQGEMAFVDAVRLVASSGSAPEVIFVSPENGAANVPVNTVVTATFTKDLDASTLTPATFTINNDGPVQGSISYDTNTRSAAFTPDASLDYGKVYLVRLSMSITGTDGTPLAKDYTWEFTTEEKTYTLALDAGWNLISVPFFVEIGERTPEILLDEILDNLEAVYAYDACVDPSSRWSIFATYGAPGNLEEIRDGRGYWCLMKDQDMLNIQGTPGPVPPEELAPYQLCYGWNLLGFKSDAAIPAGDYLAGINFGAIYGYDDAEYFAIRPNDALTPGHGYWVAVYQPGTIHF